jgi:hypothetical protein
MVEESPVVSVPVQIRAGHIFGCEEAIVVPPELLNFVSAGAGRRREEDGERV